MFKVGAKVRCVQEASHLTIGKIYIVIDMKEHDMKYGYIVDPNTDTCLIDDEGEINAWMNDRLELVEDAVDYLSITRGICGG